MKRLSVLLILGIIAGLLLPFNIPVQADDNLTIGTKIVLDNEVEATYLGRTPEGEPIWEATFGAPKYLDDLQTPIEARWSYDSKTNEWVACANLFNATVKDGNVTVEYKGKKMGWQPQLEVKAVAQSEGYASLLSNDPLNEYYIGNTLQWNYGNGITRNLRIIEGMLIEYYTIDKMPGGDITTKTNTNKDSGFNWTRPSIAWDANGTPIDLVIASDGLTLTTEAMANATFPITIDPDTTFTGTSKDGSVYGNLYGGDTWNNAHDALYGDNVQYGASASSYAMRAAYNGGFAISRAFFYFDTSSLPDTCSVTAATFKLRGYDQYDSTVSVQRGTQAATLTTADYDNFAGSKYFSQPWGSGYKSFSITVGDISKTGTTKFCAREYTHDYSDVSPGESVVYYDNGCYFYEQGAGYYPELVVTFVASAVPTITTNNATYIATTTARLNSYLVDDGGDYCDVRFQYSNVSGGGNISLDVGSGATDNNDPISYGYTRIDGANPCNGDGTITDVQIWADANMTGTKVGMFNETASNTFKCRSAETLGNITAGSLQNFTGLNLTTETGDLIGIYWTGGSLEGNLTNGTNEWHISGDTCIVDNESVYDSGAQAELSLYGFAAEASTWINTTWINDTYVQGDSPYVDIANLTISTQYFFRVQATNSIGMTNGSELNFTTGSGVEAPTNLTAYPSSHSISLVWIKGLNTTNTMIRSQIGAYPTNYTAGSQVYFDTASTATHTELSPGTTYYYRAWGESGGNYTANYTQAVTTTSAGIGAGDVPDAPTTPSGWFGTPDYTNMADFPLYNMINDIADDFGMPRNSFWLFGALAIVAIVAMFIYRHTHSGTGAMVASGVLIVAFSIAFGVPLWIIAPVMVVAIGAFMALRRV